MSNANKLREHLADIGFNERRDDSGELWSDLLGNYPETIDAILQAIEDELPETINTHGYSQYGEGFDDCREQVKSLLASARSGSKT